MQAIHTTPPQQQKLSSVVITRNESMDSEYGPNCNCSIKSNGSPEMEMKRNKTVNSANNGLTKPTAKRRLHFEEEDEDEIEGISSSRDEAFRDLASVLRGVVALKRNHMAPSSSPPKQGMLSKPPHDIAKAKRRLRLGSLQHYAKILGAQNSKECNRRTQTNRRGLKGLGKNLVHQTWNKFDKNVSEELGNRAFFQKCSRISRREPEIAPVIRNFEMLREVLDNKRKMKRTSQKLNDLGNNLLRMPGIEPFNEHIWDFNENTSEQPADETIDQSSDKYSTNSAKTLRDELCCDPKLEGICQTLKDLVKGSVQGPENEPLDENFKKSCEDRSEKPGNEVIDNSAKKYSRNSAKKRRNKPVSQAFDNSVGLGNQMICQNLQDLGNDIVQKLANEPVYKITKKFNDDRSGELGNKECGSEPLSQVLEISSEVLREGICSDPRRNVNSQKLVNNSVQNPANVLFDKHLKKFNGAISQETGNEIIDRRFKKCSRGSVNKQRNEPASHVFKRFSAVLEEGLGSESKVERNNQNLQDLGKTLVQQPVSHPVEVNKYDKERSEELANDVIDQGFLKCSRSATKEDGAEHVNQGFNKSCAVLQDGLGNEQKIQNFASSVGPKVKFHSNSDNMFSISPVTEDKGPYPDFIRPGSEECRNIRDRLLELHGFPEEFAKFRARLKDKVMAPLAARQQLLALDKKSGAENVKTEGNNEIVSCFDKKGYEIIPTVVPYEVQETMLDSLISTLLSQNTTDANSRRAFATLKERFPTWDEVYLADPKAVEDAIRCGGLAETKASRIRNILDTLLKEQGKICLEHLRSMPVEKIKAVLCRFKGIGPKTVACVLMFHLQQDDFPVDTHVYRITKSLGWVPAEADREKAYLHLNNRIPNDLKFDLNCLFVTHGKSCSSCSKRGRLRQAPDGACPLLKIGVTNN